MIRKQNIPISMGQGLDQKTDSKQITIGKYARLQNTIFQKNGLLQKRNGYASLTSLPTTASYLTTFNGNLTAIGSNLQVYANGSNSWVQKSNIQTTTLDTLPLIRSNLNQIQCDSAVSANNLVCTVYSETGTGSTTYSYAVADATTGQNVIAPTILTATGSGRVFCLGNYFIILYTYNSSLNYVYINIYDFSVSSTVKTLSSVYSSSTGVNFDGAVMSANGNLYVFWNGSEGGGAIHATYINPYLTIATPYVLTGYSATLMGVSCDTGNQIAYCAFYNGTNSYIYALTAQLAPIFSTPYVKNLSSSGTLLNITCAAQSGVCSVFYEVSNTYTYNGLATNYVQYNTVTQAGVVGANTTLLRSVGLASKAFIVNGSVYVTTTYSSSFQPTYFVVDVNGNVLTKLAYSNGGGYLTLGLPSVIVLSTTAYFSYLYKDLVQATNKAITIQSGTSSPVYSQTGINLASIGFTTAKINTAEIGGNLNITSGLTRAYDGYSMVEQGFNLWPDDIKVTTSTTGSGSIPADTYWYYATYEWSDNQGNVFRSAPSIPYTIPTTGATSTNTVYIPCLRVTAKTANPVKIVVYRYSNLQQIPYQITSIVSPKINSTTTDYITVTDTYANNSIIGNNILYTYGGTVENIGAPPSSILTLYRSRLFAVDAEDQNLLWYSKQVIEATPVEMSDLFTIYVAPTTSAAANTGPITALSALDDKLIIFKNDAIYYITGTGPDNTGANNDFSDPIFITSTVGCSNQNSIVFMPQGLMFQSDKGIWLLGRDLSTQYIGAPVEDYNGYSVLSAVNIPATNQVRFTLSNGVTLMYDYYFGQWGTFNGVPAVSSCIYQGLHTYINSYGSAYQESPGAYLDGSSPVLIGLTTGWINPAGLQGYLRSYCFYILGQYFTPHKLQVGIAYDYNSSPSQTDTITPLNYSANYGGDTPYGAGSPYGGPGNLEQWRIFLAQQRCLAFQINIDEIYDSSKGVAAGQGLTISGLNLLVGIKSGWNTISSTQSVG